MEPERIAAFVAKYAWAQTALVIICLAALKELGTRWLSDRKKKDEEFEIGIASLNSSMKENTRAIDKLVLSLEFLQKRTDKIPELDSDLTKLGESHRAFRTEIKAKLGMP